MIVETKKILIDSKLECASGEALENFELMTDFYGELNEKKDNAVLVCHAFSGSHHAAGKRDGNIGWWDEFIGPDKTINTNRFFVVSVNNLGSCFGSSGPLSKDKNGERFNNNFPQLEVIDWVESQKMLADKLGIKKWHLVIGGSLGGMQSLQWAVSYPKMVKKVGILAAAAKTSSQNIALNEVEREVIRKDSDFHDGKYLEFNKSPAKGLKAARMLGHITYLSAKNMDQRFGRKLQNTDSKIAEDVDFEIENYLQYKGGKFAESFDANSYILLTKVMDKFDIAHGHDDSLESALKNITAEVLVVSFTSDWMFPTSNGKEICLASIKANKKCSYIELEGEHGHDSFLYPNEDYQNAIKNFIESE